jgi:hypothetical protein
MANKILWAVQGILAALFLFAGGMKLAMPAAALEQQAHMSGLFLKFIGVAEFAGGLGLILPGVFHIREGLTPLAAIGLVIIMIGATAISGSPIPALVGLFAIVVAWYRRPALAAS